MNPGGTPISFESIQAAKELLDMQQQAAASINGTSLLPYTPEYEACDIRTRRIIRVPGERIDAFQVGEKLFVAQSLVEKLIEETPPIQGTYSDRLTSIPMWVPKKHNQ